MPGAAIGELERVAVEAPAGEGARGFLDVALAVVPLAQRESSITSRAFSLGAWRRLPALSR
jgi:hypothetical protein